MQKRLEECIAHLLQYVNKFGDDANKLARAVGSLITMQLLPISVLSNLNKEHLVKDGMQNRWPENCLAPHFDALLH